jgi:serine/threonine-protein kinase HipA
MSINRQVNRCPISYESLDAGGTYSESGLKRLSRQMEMLARFPYSAEEQVREAAARFSKMSIQGVQPKLSARLTIKKKEGIFEIVDRKGQFILKPQNQMFPQMPENEDLTMKMAELAGIHVPVHGLIYSRDNTLTYFIKRFDRVGKDKKLYAEDFAQLIGKTRETKYNSSMEKAAKVIEDFCTFPVIEKVKFFRLTIFNFLVGNEDMHLKNFSLVRKNDKIELSPAYDLVNTTIAVENPIEEIALPLGGKKRKLTAKLLIDYFGKKRLGLNDKVIERVLEDIARAFPRCDHLVEISFLSGLMKLKYKELLSQRRAVLRLQV